MQISQQQRFLNPGPRVDFFACYMYIGSGLNMPEMGNEVLPNAFNSRLIYMYFPAQLKINNANGVMNVYM